MYQLRNKFKFKQKNKGKNFRSNPLNACQAKNIMLTLLTETYVIFINRAMKLFTSQVRM